jgi:hypothetical protein
MKSAVVVFTSLLTLSISVLSAPVPSSISEENRSIIMGSLIGGLSAILLGISMSIVHGVINFVVLTKGIDHGIARMMQYDQWKKGQVPVEQSLKVEVEGNDDGEESEVGELKKSDGGEPSRREFEDYDRVTYRSDE